VFVAGSKVLSLKIGRTDVLSRMVDFWGRAVCIKYVMIPTKNVRYSAPHQSTSIHKENFKQKSQDISISSHLVKMKATFLFSIIAVLATSVMATPVPETDAAKIFGKFPVSYWHIYQTSYSCLKRNLLTDRQSVHALSLIVPRATTPVWVLPRTLAAQHVEAATSDASRIVILVV